MEKVRVRFAPSPTGPLHMGGVRTALYNYLFARRHGGDFILRIEDTDRTRYVPGAVDYIREALEWAGIRPDEGYGYGGDRGPYRQSERTDIYRQYVQQLIDSGKAYYAFDTPEELEALRQEAASRGEVFTYGHRNRMQLQNSLALGPEETRRRLEAGMPYVVRFKVEPGRRLRIRDLVRGEVEVDTSELDDKVLLKSDGMPTYHLANIVDDHLMGITHVIRGEEWLPSLPLHVLLYEAFGWEPPRFAHLPLILKPKGKGKLSKRDGELGGFPVFPLKWKDPETGREWAGYREEGYLPQAFVNMLALLGWNPGDEREIFTLDELVETFDLDRVHKSGARFDPDKAVWFQHRHFQRLPDEQILELIRPVAEEGLGRPLTEAELELTRRVLPLVRERLIFPRDYWTWASYFYIPPHEYAPKAVKKQWKTATPELMRQVRAFLAETEPWTASRIKENLSEWITSRNLGFGKVLQPLRIALTGDLKGPDLFAMMEILGKDETLARIDRALEALG
ncbi:MAG: glutamate--tRNA ligase [Chlorobi bacterium]|nr:glutamate--tRNA ligase [Chlorobiota bacterium]